MKKEFNKTVISTLFISLMGISSVAQSAVTLDRTRVIFPGTEKSINITIRNDNPTLPYLAQTWIDDANEKKLTTGPLIATPPIQRLDPKSSSIVQISTTPSIASLPKDRETVFYYNLREVPPKSEEANILQIALQSRVKLFYRPAEILSQADSMWFHNVTLTPSAKGYTVNNVTPFYLTVIGLASTQKASETGAFSVVMIPPKSDHEFAVPKTNVPYMTIINDYGGKPTLQFKCDQAKCTVAKEM
ncbi:fimbria/pilus periplasmic chaperone [Proteus vulgaris]|uniref:Fimbria/pilus periplasmic chaperone n=1 Tax=Proteus vulgaris TaxID=585 RepID=A0A6G6SDU7_PROVU|nr:fimbria/pilus periplasmic chaperone [Proteus vulgaris]QIF92685.1 fimbria/pilus periplasmic chaperone [Proteus vulgaris]